MSPDLVSVLLPRLVKQLPECRLHGISPDAVALGAQMEEVGHDLARDRPVRLEEHLADIKVVDVLAVMDGRDQPVHLGELGSRLVRLLAPGKDAEQQYLRIREPVTQFLDDECDPGGNLLGNVCATLLVPIIRTTTLG